MKRKLKSLKNRIAIVISDDDKKGGFQILREAINFWIVKGEFPYFYFGKFLYRKEVKNYKEYLSSKEVDKITLSKNLHHFQYASLLRNKLAFALHMERNKVAIPSLISYNLGHRFFYQSNMHVVTDVPSLISYFEGIFDKTGKHKVFVKIMAEMGGKGAYLITKENLKKEINAYADHILNNDCIHQDVIEQHQDINVIYPYSINTIRFDSYLDKKGTIHILSAFMRFGAGGAVVDNSSSGGMFVRVNLATGKLQGKSYRQMKYGGRRLAAHPDTDIVFNDFQIPYFLEACELVKNAVSVIPDRYIGWDIAITPSGPVIVEGNDNNSLIAPDIAYGGYLGHPLYAEIMDEA